jgi:outer membrane protein TolC
VRLDAELAMSERDLASLTGVPGERARAANLVAVALADEAIEPVDESVARALGQNADVRAAGEQAAAAEAGARAAQGAYWPQLALVGNYTLWGDLDGVESREWNVGVQLSQNIFTGGAVSGRAAKRAAASRLAGETLRLARIQATRDVEAAHDRVREAAATVQSLRVAAASYDEVARIEALSREVGSGTQTDYLTAEADVVIARARLAEARHAEIAARLELARLTGDLTPEWLARHLEARP